MNHVVVELSVRTAPLALVERASSGVPALLRSAAEVVERGAAHEALVVATCNRVELHAVAAEACAVRKAAKAALSEAAGFSVDELRTAVRVHRGEDAVRHTLRLACGLESMVLGEREILGQMRRARVAAETAGTSGPRLAALFRRASSAGRRARHEAALGRGVASVASVAASLTANAFDDLSQRRVLVVGAGETARSIVRNLQKRGAHHVLVANRTHARAEDLARELGARAVDFHDLGELLAECDIVAVATSAREFILGPAVVDPAMARRESGEPVVMLDLSMPRNIDPAVGDIDGVFLYSLQDIEQVAAANLASRAGDVARVEAIVDAETARHMEWLARGAASELADDLRRRMEELRRAHLERFASALPPEERERADRLTESLVRALLHDVTRNVRSLADDTQDGAREIDVARRLLGLPERAPKT